jgi:hypothetical protein
MATGAGRVAASTKEGRFILRRLAGVTPMPTALFGPYPFSGHRLRQRRKEQEVFVH